MTWLTVIGLVLTCAIGIYKWIARMKSEKRRLADEAQAKIDKATGDGDESDLLDGFNTINRAKR